MLGTSFPGEIAYLIISVLVGAETVIARVGVMEGRRIQ